jgi:hypothetical protein
MVIFHSYVYKRLPEGSQIGSSSQHIPTIGANKSHVPNHQAVQKIMCHNPLPHDPLGIQQSGNWPIFGPWFHDLPKWIMVMGTTATCQITSMYTIQTWGEWEGILQQKLGEIPSFHAAQRSHQNTNCGRDSGSFFTWSQLQISFDFQSMEVKLGPLI